MALRQFVAERNWQQFHAPENLVKSIAIESAELLELFQWSEPIDIDDVKDELADVLTYCILLADKYDLDIEKIVLLAKNGVAALVELTERNCGLKKACEIANPSLALAMSKKLPLPHTHCHTAEHGFFFLSCL